MLSTLYSLLFFHAFYLSVAEVTIDDKGICKIELKVFQDDISDAVRAFSGELIPRSGVLSAQDIIHLDEYLKNHLYIKSEVNKSDFQVLSVSSEGDSLWINLISDQLMGKKHTIRASYLMELFPDQVNMIHLNINGDQQFKQIKGKNLNLDFTI